MSDERDDGRGTVTISFETAEYLAVMAGQNLWGNPERRRKACHDLGFAMGNRQMSRSLECFTPPKKEKGT